jgi:DNA-binding response OmpR family regulator
VLVVGYVLVVDDDPGVREFASAALALGGFPTKTAASGAEVLADAREKRPALVVLDVRLPGVSGYEILRRLREELGPELPVIFLSEERRDPFDRPAGLLLGADDYLIKPFAPESLLARVQAILARVERAAGTGSELTKSEKEVRRLLSAGRTQAEIAEQLVISPNTVAMRVEQILTKLSAHNHAQAVAIAHRDGVI